jgi:hypothetical protein
VESRRQQSHTLATGESYHHGDLQRQLSEQCECEMQAFQAQKVPAEVATCRRPSAVVNLNCVTNRVAPGSRYKLSYDAKQYNTIHTLLNILYLQPPHPTVRQL